MVVAIDINKAKEITHDKLREARAGEFKPLDAQINIYATNATKVTEIESQRQVIRDKYTTIQENIDACVSADELKTIIESL